MNHHFDVLTFVVTIVGALVSGPGVWGIISHFMTKKRTLREEERQEEKDRVDRQRIEDERRELLERAADERRELLSAAQTAAQKAALDSSDKRFDDLHDDYKNCQTALTTVREVTWLLIDVLEGFMMRLQPIGDNGAEEYTVTVRLAEVGQARRAITEARNRLR